MRAAVSREGARNVSPDLLSDVYVKASPKLHTRPTANLAAAPRSGYHLPGHSYSMGKLMSGSRIVVFPWGLLLVGTPLACQQASLGGDAVATLVGRLDLEGLHNLR